jgi:hypothetical protein
MSIRAEAELWRRLNMGEYIQPVLKPLLTGLQGAGATHRFALQWLCRDIIALCALLRIWNARAGSRCRNASNGWICVPRSFKDVCHSPLLCSQNPLSSSTDKHRPRSPLRRRRYRHHGHSRSPGRPRPAHPAFTLPRRSEAVARYLPSLVHEREERACVWATMMGVRNFGGNGGWVSGWSGRSRQGESWMSWTWPHACSFFPLVHE